MSVGCVKWSSSQNSGTAQIWKSRKTGGDRVLVTDILGPPSGSEASH